VISLLVGAALAKEPVTLHGDVKSFFTASLPYESNVFPSEPSGQGVLDLRLKFEARPSDALTFLVHGTSTGLAPAPVAGSGLGTSTGVGLRAPEIVELSYIWEEGTLQVRGRIDRASARLETGSVTTTVGRQPISFGNGFAFTPLDLVNPFTPAVIDQEYKPGVDAVRVDGYRGMSVLTVSGAYAGDWNDRGLVGVAYAQTTVGVTDIGALVGTVQADRVLGATVVTSIGAVGLHSDVTVTASEDRDPFVRAVAGALWRPGANTTLTGEAYVQTLGGGSPDEYLSVVSDRRFASGQLWLMGRTYGAVSVAQQVTPLISAGGALITNVEDGSAFVAPNFSWSVGSNTTFVAGGFVGLGERPGSETQSFTVSGVPIEATVPVLKSEFGTYPAALFAQLKAYF
jgi:hypothetical protein